MTTIAKKYKTKKASTAKRKGVGFELSLEEFKVLYDKADVCDYTGESFSDEQGTHIKSLERIDKHLPYRKDNCCVVTHKANLIKDRFESNTGSVLITDMEILDRIRTTLANKTRQELVNKYFPDVVIEKENTDKRKVVMKEEKQGISDGIEHEDRAITQSFLAFYGKNPECSLSFSDYKKLYKRKSCMFTGITFEKGSSYTDRAFIKIDENDHWSKDNTKVVCKVVRTIVNSKLTSKDLVKLSKLID